MQKNISPSVVWLRQAVEEVLHEAARPMTANEIAVDTRVAVIGEFNTDLVSRHLSAMTKLRDENKPFPIYRIEHFGPGTTRWAYYDKRVCQPLAVTKKVNAVNSEPKAVAEGEPVYPSTPEFEFNPVEFTDTPPTPAQARVITITLPGVNIRIEMGDNHETK